MRPYQLPEAAPQSPIYASIEGLAGMSVPVHILRRNKAVLAIDHTQPIQQRSKNTAPVLWLDRSAWAAATGTHARGRGKTRRRSGWRAVFRAVRVETPVGRLSRVT